MRPKGASSWSAGSHSTLSVSCFVSSTRSLTFAAGTLIPAQGRLARSKPFSELLRMGSRLEGGGEEFTLVFCSLDPLGGRYDASKPSSAESGSLLAAISFAREDETARFANSTSKMRPCQGRVPVGSFPRKRG